MNRSESKYFNTALLMDEALICLLEKKDIEYITVKELCQKAGVGRSTFYLHYETMDDLAKETQETVEKKFRSYFKVKEKNIKYDELKDLVFVTDDYVVPYLQFIYDNKNVYRAALRNVSSLGGDTQYLYLKKNFIEPVMERFRIPEDRRKYYIAYYMEGISAVIREWLLDKCADPIETVASVIKELVVPPHGREGRAYGE